VATCICAALTVSASALAAPITVNLRVEGSGQTLFEGPVSTEAIPSSPGIITQASLTAHPCDVADNGANEGFVPSGASPTAALYDAALSHGLAFNATWSSSLNDFFVSQVGSDVNGGEAEGFPSWGYAVNHTTANVGGCQFQLASGSEVLWAYNYFNLVHQLSVSGPASVSVGTPFVVHVTDGQTGEPIPGAAIGEVNAGVTTTIPSSPPTDASGNATVSLTHAGSVTLKATRADSVRSNGLSVCLHAGNDGSCGTSVNGGVGSTNSTKTAAQPATAEIAEVLGIKSGHVYSRHSAPRVLRGEVKIAAGGTLHELRIRLERRYRGRCFDFSGSSEKFARARKCGPASFFSVGGQESFSYLLPAPLPAGRYVYDIEAVDSTGHVTKLAGGVSHVVFRVK
jgi:hypothetical protein